MYNTGYPFTALPPVQEEVMQVNGKDGANAVSTS